MNVNSVADSFIFPSVDGFVPGVTVSGYFVHVVVSNEEELRPGSVHYDPGAKPKYCLVIAYPREDKKLKIRCTEYEKYSCSQEDFDFLNACPDLPGRPVYFTVDVNSWAVGDSRHGVWYRFVSGSLRRFDGQPLGALPAGKGK